MKEENLQQNKFQGRILLTVMPFWTPLIPPLGIGCIKGYLSKKDYDVKTYDMNINDDILNIHFKYYSILASIVPESNKGNFYNIGNDVFHNHMMIHLNYENKKDYYELTRAIVKNTFAITITDEYIARLVNVIEEFYGILDREIDKLLKENKPNVLGVSVYRGNLAASSYIAKKAKEYDSSIITIMGGGIFADQLSIGSTNFNNFLEFSASFMDKIIVGEGELLFEYILENELYSDKRVYTLKDIDNKLVDIEYAEYPELCDFELKKYPYITTYSSRSCPYECKFCSETVQWGKYRKKSPKRIIDEMCSLSEKHNSQLFLLGDSLLNPIVDGMSKEFMKTDKALYWDGYLRAEKEVCDLKNTELWRQGGFYRARLGVESGSERVLKLMNKKINVNQIKDALYSLATAGIKTTTYWVIGYPLETEEDFQETLNLIKELKDYIWEAECNPFGFYPSGQVNSNQWLKSSKRLYDEKYRKQFIVEPWDIISNPNHEEKFDRVYRFVEWCKNLGIPNPYNFKDIYEADKRWHKLHKSSVPYLFEFMSEDNYITECKKFKRG